MTGGFYFATGPPVLFLLENDEDNTLHRCRPRRICPRSGKLAACHTVCSRARRARTGARCLIQPVHVSAQHCKPLSRVVRWSCFFEHHFTGVGGQKRLALGILWVSVQQYIHLSWRNSTHQMLESSNFSGRNSSI